MPSRHHNPERSAWRGRSHRKGGERIALLRWKIVDVETGCDLDEVEAATKQQALEEFASLLDEPLQPNVDAVLKETDQ